MMRAVASLLNLVFSYLFCFNPLSFALHGRGDKGKKLPVRHLFLLVVVRTLLAFYLGFVPSDR